MKKNEVKWSPIERAALLLVNHCKRQPVDRLVSHDEIRHIVQFDPCQTRVGRAIMRRALRVLLKDGFVFLVKRGYGIYRSEGIHYRMGGAYVLQPKSDHTIATLGGVKTFFATLKAHPDRSGPRNSEFGIPLPSESCATARPRLF
jgi:hypothetical protein